MNTVLSHALDRFLSPATPGWCTPEKAAAMVEIIADDRPRIVVEIGVFAGRSLGVIGMALRENGVMARAYGLDPK